MHLDTVNQVYRNVSLADLEERAKDVLKWGGGRRIWLFYGDMGAGKTTFIKSLCHALGVDDMVASPTFSIINEYKRDAGESVFHFDFYRIKNEEEAYEIGAEDYFYSGSYCFIEWPEKIPSLIPFSHVKVNIQVEDNQHRTLAISIHDGEEKNRI